MDRKLTFRKLKIGDKFIAFPIPGDNHGHGGFLGRHKIFIKTRKTKGAPGGYNNAVMLSSGMLAGMPESMFVIQVE